MALPFDQVVRHSGHPGASAVVHPRAGRRVPFIAEKATAYCYVGRPDAERATDRLEQIEASQQ